VFVLMKSDPSATPAYRGITCLIAQKEPGLAPNVGPYTGFQISPKIKKPGYRGIETSEEVFDGYRCPPTRIP
jgi:alkylation response protein AidB-like acyl-CoA dehydrogenase